MTLKALNIEKAGKQNSCFHIFILHTEINGHYKRKLSGGLARFLMISLE